MAGYILRRFTCRQQSPIQVVTVSRELRELKLSLQAAIFNFVNSGHRHVPKLLLVTQCLLDC